jgi:hypothetical protein
MRLGNFLLVLTFWVAMLGLSLTGLGAVLAMIWSFALVFVIALFAGLLHIEMLAGLWVALGLYGAIAVVVAVFGTIAIAQADWYEALGRWAIVVSMAGFVAMLWLSTQNLNDVWPVPGR